MWSKATGRRGAVVQKSKSKTTWTDTIPNWRAGSISCINPLPLAGFKTKRPPIRLDQPASGTNCTSGLRHSNAKSALTVCCTTDSKSAMAIGRSASQKVNLPSTKVSARPVQDTFVCKTTTTKCHIATSNCERSATTDPLHNRSMAN